MHKSNTDELVSALVDGELGGRRARRLLGELASGGDAPSGLDTWKRYHLIGGVLRDEHQLMQGAERVSQRVAQAIAEEAPAPAQTVGPRPAAWRERLWSMLPQGEEGAASVTVGVMATLMIGFFTLNLLPSEFPDSGRETPTAIVMAPAPTPTMRWDSFSPDMEQTMNAFLVEHGAFAGAHGMNGLSSYVRFVGYDAPGN